MTDIHTQRIAQLNDVARRAMGIACRVFITEGIRQLSCEDQSAIREKVEKFNDFTPDNDPYGEHDFGIIQLRRVGSIYWKIDYYDPSLSYGSEDPSDLSVTHRVLTIMLAEEY